MRKNTLFTVPLFCIAASLVSFYLIVYGIGRFAIVTLPDGTVTSDANRSLLIYGFILAASLIIGGLLFFKKLTKKEILVSATIWAVFHLVLLLIELLFDVTGSLAAAISYLGMTSDWCSFIPMLLMRLTNSFIFSAVVGCLSPYLFVFFGKKR